MAEADNKAQAQAAEKTALETARAKAVMNRRYVGTRETASYILYDVAQSFNINNYRDLFVTNIMRISLKFQAAITPITGAWDIINDVLVAAVVDKTRTRWGKFKPWLIVYAIPGVLLSIAYWAMPMFFSGRSEVDVTKLAFYLVLQLITDLATTVSDIARTGSLATITPNIIDRTRLITEANLLSGFIENAPKIIMGILIDFVQRGVMKTPLRSVYVSAGVFTTVVSGILALIFAFVVKERVSQTVDKPEIKDSLKSIITNKPLLLITLAEFLSAFSVSSGVNYYYNDVLGLNSMATIVGIPGAFVSPVSYSYVPWARKRFSTRTLWLVGAHLDDVLLIGVFAVGSINKNYKKLSAMIPAFMIRETIWMTVYGIRKVIPEEMRNEAIDYGEWKNGYRTEGMTGVAKGLATKAVNTLGSTIKSAILANVGYKEGAGFGGQSESTEYALFTMCTILPVVTGIFSIIPKFFYDLTGEKRDRMYRELHERRKAREEQYDAMGNDTVAAEAAE